MPRILLGRDGAVEQFVHPDEDGFTVETRFHDTEAIVDDLKAKKSFDPKPRAYTRDGVCWRHVGSIPMFLIHRWYQELGHWPDKEFILNKLRSREFSHLLATEEKF